MDAYEEGHWVSMQGISWVERESLYLDMNGVDGEGPAESLGLRLKGYGFWGKDVQDRVDGVQRAGDLLTRAQRVSLLWY